MDVRLAGFDYCIEQPRTQIAFIQLQEALCSGHGHGGSVALLGIHTGHHACTHLHLGAN